MAKKFYTIDDLYNFCKENHFEKFSSAEKGAPLIVQSFGEIEAADTSTMGLTPCTLMACHTELNRNKSFISEESMNNALKSFSNRPILGYIHKLDDGTWNFWDHRMSIEEDGDESRVEYLERPIGVIPESCNAHLEYDEDNDKNYVVVNGYIYDDYGNRAIDIIKNNGGKVFVSVELAINEMSFNAKENYLVIEDFTFMGVTCLGKCPDGTEVQPGMEGANLKLDSFSAKQNSMFDEVYQEKLLNTLERINQTLSMFSNKNNTEEGVIEEMGHFDELLEKYGFTVDELDFDYENMSDEELDSAFEDFKCRKKKCEEEDSGVDGSEEGNSEEACSEEGTSEEGSSEEENPEDSNDDEDDTGDDESKKNSENFVKNFKVEISHEDIRYALYNLIAEYEESDNEWYGIYAVYDDYFIMQGWCNGKFYKQGYSIDGENVSLDGERTELFQMLLTESEKLAVDKLRGDYAELEAKYNELKTFKDNYDATEIKAKKDSIFADEAYNDIRESDDFKSLMNDAEKYSVEEIQNKCDLLFAANEKKIKFAANKNKSHSISFNFSKKEDKKTSAYGNLFKND